MSADVIDRGANPLLTAAVAYARRGWPVIPLHTARANGQCSCGRADCASVGKHPRTAHGLADASIVPREMCRWWQRWPSANVGLVTGVAFDVLDVDSADALAALDARRPPEGELPLIGPMVATGKGWHFYWSPTGHGNRAGIVPGADWRGRGGYVVAPPSVHANGRRYAWHDGPEVPIPSAEPWLLALVAPPPPAPRPPVAYIVRDRNASVGGLIAAVATAPEGNRNAALHWAACRLAEDAASGRVRDVAEACGRLHLAAVRAGLSDHEAERTIRSGLAGGGHG